MPFEMLVALEVIDEECYNNYRVGMIPLLENFGGTFEYDFQVSNVLKGKSTGKINRLFIIRFETQELSMQFFSHPEYLAVKEKYFTRAVAHTEIIAKYHA